MIEFLTAHPLMALDLPSISSLSTKPILFMQVPALNTVHDKLTSFIDGVPSLADPSKNKGDLAQEIFPWLKLCYVEKSNALASPAVVATFGRTMVALAAGPPTDSMFLLFDIWRLAIFEPTIAQVTLTLLVKVLASNSESISSAPRASLPTLLRLTTNALGNTACPIATASCGSSGSSGGAHERAGADAFAPGPACACGGCNSGVQRWCLGAEGPGFPDQGGGGGQGRRGGWDTGGRRGRLSLSARLWRLSLVRKRARMQESYTFLVLVR